MEETINVHDIGSVEKSDVRKSRIQISDETNIDSNPWKISNEEFKRINPEFPGHTSKPKVFDILDFQKNGNGQRDIPAALPKEAPQKAAFAEGNKENQSNSQEGFSVPEGLLEHVDLFILSGQKKLKTLRTNLENAKNEEDARKILNDEFYSGRLDNRDLKILLPYLKGSNHSVTELELEPKIAEQEEQEVVEDVQKVAEDLESQEEIEEKKDQDEIIVPVENPAESGVGSSEPIEEIDAKLVSARADYANKVIDFENKIREKKGNFAKIMATLGVPEKHMPESAMPQELIEAKNAYIEAKKKKAESLYPAGSLVRINTFEVNAKEKGAGRIEYSVDSILLDHVEKEREILNKLVEKSTPIKEKNIFRKSWERFVKNPIAARIGVSVLLLGSSTYVGNQSKNITEDLNHNGVKLIDGIHKKINKELNPIVVENVAVKDELSIPFEKPNFVEDVHLNIYGIGEIEPQNMEKSEVEVPVSSRGIIATFQTLQENLVKQFGGKDKIPSTAQDFIKMSPYKIAEQFGFVSSQDGVNSSKPVFKKDTVAIEGDGDIVYKHSDGKQEVLYDAATHKTHIYGEDGKVLSAKSAPLRTASTESPSKDAEYIGSQNDSEQTVGGDSGISSEEDSKLKTIDGENPPDPKFNTQELASTHNIFEHNGHKYSIDDIADNGKAIVVDDVVIARGTLGSQGYYNMPLDKKFQDGEEYADLRGVYIVARGQIREAPLGKNVFPIPFEGGVVEVVNNVGIIQVFLNGELISKGLIDENGPVVGPVKLDNPWYLKDPREEVIKRANAVASELIKTFPHMKAAKK